MEHHQCTQINTSTISHQNVHIRRGGRRDHGEGAWPGDELTCGRGGRRDPGEGAADGGRARQTAGAADGEGDGGRGRRAA